MSNRVLFTTLETRTLRGDQIELLQISNGYDKYEDIACPISSKLQKVV